MSSLSEILAAAQALPSHEQAQLVAALWNQLAPADWVPPNSEWVAEANRRSDLIDSGDMASSAWAEVRARVRRQAGLDD